MSPSTGFKGSRSFLKYVEHENGEGSSSEMLLLIYQLRQHYMPEDLNQQHHHQLYQPQNLHVLTSIAWQIQVLLCKHVTLAWSSLELTALDYTTKDKDMWISTSDLYNTSIIFLFLLFFSSPLILSPGQVIFLKTFQQSHHTLSISSPRTIPAFHNSFSLVCFLSKTMVYTIWLKLQYSLKYFPKQVHTFIQVSHTCTHIWNFNPTLFFCFHINQFSSSPVKLLHCFGAYSRDWVRALFKVNVAGT